MTQEILEIVTLRRFLDCADDEQCNQLIGNLMIFKTDAFIEFFNAPNAMSIESSKHFQEMMDENCIHIKWINDKMTFVRLDEKIMTRKP